MYLRLVGFSKYVALLSVLVAVSVNAASAVSEKQGSAAEPFENFHGMASLHSLKKVSPRISIFCIRSYRDRLDIKAT